MTSSESSPLYFLVSMASSTALPSDKLLPLPRTSRRPRAELRGGPATPGCPPGSSEQPSQQPPQPEAASYALPSPLPVIFFAGTFGAPPPHDRGSASRLSYQRRPQH